MTVKVSRVDTWVAGLKDQRGALAAKLKELAAAGANVEFLIARRAPEKPGTGVVFVAPLKGPGQLKAAKRLGFAKSKSLHSVRVEGGDKRGMGAKLTQALAEAGLNLRGLSAAAIGGKFVCYIAVDKAADAMKAMRVLKQM